MDFNVMSTTHSHLRPEKKNGGRVKEKGESVKRREGRQGVEDR